MMDGIRALGNRREYAVAAGTMRNEKPIAITVEQWFSPELGVMLVKSSHASTGGESTYRLDDIVQAEPELPCSPFPRTTRSVAAMSSRRIRPSATNRSAARTIGDPGVRMLVNFQASLQSLGA